MKVTTVLGYRLAIRAAVMCVLALAGGIDGACAKSGREARSGEGQANAPGAPMLAIVSLSDQRVSIYDGDGRRILQSPVSTGQAGLETPAGIYSVVQKKQVHQSNVYEDGNMPFMQRITWTGIALHAGVLPGQPASHGCVRMPHAFAQHLFGLTDIGLRVLIVRDDIAPTEIEHPVLFKPDQRRRELALATPPVSDRPPAVRWGMSAPSEVPLALGSPRHLQLLRATADAKSAQASAGAKKASEARQLALRKAAEAAPAVKTLRAAEANAAKAEELLRGAERALDAARAKAAGQSTPEAAASEDAVRAADLAKEKASAKVAEAQAQLETAKAQVQSRTDAATRADEDAKQAEAARDAAVEAAEEAGRKTSPVSVFISRKTQRLYVRQGYVPVFEGPVSIRDADKPIGTFVFTALGYRNAGDDVRWSVVSMYAYSEAMEPVVQPPRTRGDGRGFEAIAADVTAAKAALDRITIAPDDLERISEVVLPGSSLIITDEGASIETGKDTDFVVVMSGEPQGGLKTRRREPRYRYDDFFGMGRSPFGFFWN
jgi:hypothetical protein